MESGASDTSYRRYRKQLLSHGQPADIGGGVCMAGWLHGTVRCMYVAMHRMLDASCHAFRGK